MGVVDEILVVCPGCKAQLDAQPGDLRRLRRGQAVLRECGACYNGRIARYRATRAAREAAARQAHVQAARQDPTAALSRCGVPSHYLGASFDNCPDLPAGLVLDVRAWAESPVGMLLLTGAAGAGKSWLAVAALRYVLTAGALLPVECRFIGEGEYLEALRASYGDGIKDVPAAWLPDGHPLKARLLVFDDLASSRLTEWGRGEVARLVEYRHARDLPTIVTTNLGPAEIATAIDARVASRLVEYSRVIVMGGRDLRMAGSLRGGQH